MYIYHERQLGALCGCHCVNNLLQGPRFGPGDLAEIGVRLDKKERRLLGGQAPDGEAGSGGNFDGSADGGNFSIDVLRIALARAGLKVLPADHPDGRERMNGDPARAAGAYLVQRRGHWYALRATGPCWWDLDSLLERPKPLDERALASQLGRLIRGSHSSVFLVVGGTLPEPRPPTTHGVEGGSILSTGGEGFESNWHDAMALLSSASSLSTGTSTSSTAIPAASAVATCPLQPPAEVPEGESTAGAGKDEREDELAGLGQAAEVRAALALAGGNRSVAADVLRKARQSIADLLLDTPPPRLARAISAAVDAVLQARRSLPDSIARLVALLCAPAPDALAAVVALVDCGELADRLLTALSRKARGFLWTEGLSQAATIAVDLLLALPATLPGSSVMQETSPTLSSNRDDDSTPVSPSLAPASVARCVAAAPPPAWDAFVDSDVGLTVAAEGRPAGRPVVSEPGLRTLGPMPQVLTQSRGQARIREKEVAEHSSLSPKASRLPGTERLTRQPRKVRVSHGSTRAQRASRADDAQDERLSVRGKNRMLAQSF